MTVPTRRSPLRPRRSSVTAGIVAMLLGTAVVAVPSTAAAEPPTDCEPILDEVVSGAEAVDELGADLATVARDHGLSSRELRETLLDDTALHVSQCGVLFFDDARGPGDDVHAHGDETHGVGETDEAEWIPWRYWSDWDPADALRAAAELDVFALHTLPGADRTVYLDFTGGSLASLWANHFGRPAGFPLSPFDADGDPTSFSDVERAAIYDIWAQVAEDFAPFAVDITTEAPDDSDVTRQGADDQRYGTTHLITQDPRGSLGGVAWVGVFGDPRPSTAAYVRQGGFTFTGAGDALLSPHQIGSIVSHEIGHNLHLLHHGLRVGTGWYEYHPGNPVWTPLMGNGGSLISQWSDGQYPSATRPQQDDLAIMGQHLPAWVDDHGGTPAAATRLALDESVAGRILSRSDRDAFAISGKDPMRVAVTTAPFGPNLDVRATVLDAAGDATLLVVDPPVTLVPGSFRPAGLDVDEVLDLPAGDYHLVIEGTSFGSAEDGYVTGYSDYGSLGTYTVEVTRACGGSSGTPSVCRPDKPDKPVKPVKPTKP
jgi:hypothetical protein